MTNNKNLLEKMCSSLEIVYEYASPPIYALKYQNGLEIFERPNCQQIQQISAEKDNTLHYGVQKFQKSNLIRNIDGGYVYLPLKKHFSDIFQCIQDLQSFFPVEQIFAAFSWKEFEEFLTKALVHYGIHAFRTFRYSINKKRYEVDVITRDRNKIFFIDAKRWASRTASPSALKKAAEQQYKRAQAVIKDPGISGQLLQKLEYSSFSTLGKVQIFPMIVVSSSLDRVIIHDHVPILSFSLFCDFLNQFDCIVSELSPITLHHAQFQTKLFS